MKYNYNWTLKDANFTKDKGKVFSCFSCGGGSTMGYKLAGFDVIGCNEIDPKLMACYVENHKPNFSFLESITTFKLRNDLPGELYNLDILDGSPPCSSFSMAGNREKDWGKEKKFREGQQNQILDTLFFDFIDLGKKLQPKIIIAENVKGIIQGGAKDYVKKIYRQFDDAGYSIQHYLLDSSKMGVPQKRERVFFIGLRKDLTSKIENNGLYNYNPKLDMKFHQRKIPVKDFLTGTPKKPNQNYSSVRFGDVMVNPNEPCNTIATDINRYWIDENTMLSKDSILKIGSFPTDYRFLNNNFQYVIGMSVPPCMMANIANEVYNQWLFKLST